MKKLLILTITVLSSLAVTAQIPTDKHLIKYLEINTTKSDYGLTFLDEDKVVFAMPIDEQSKGTQSDLFIGDIEEKGEISNKELIRGMRQIKKVSRTGITYSIDLKTVFFSAKKDKRKKSKEKDQLFRATIDASGNWINIEKLPFNSDKYSTGQPSLSHDGKRLYFVSDGLGSYGGSKDIFVVDVNDDGTYGEPINLGDKINTKGDEVTPYITEGNMLYFSSNGRSDSKGSLDVYASEVFNSTVSESFHLEAPINSINDDFAYILNKKNNAGYFSSNRLQGQDNNDIYSFIIEETKPEKCLQEIAGIVKDKETDEVINDAAMTLFDEEGNQIQQIVTDKDGAYHFVLDCNQTYTLVASSLYYIKDEHIINTANYTNAPALEANKLLIKKTGAELEEALAAAKGEEISEEEIAVTEEEVAVAETVTNETEAPVSPVYFGFDRSDITNEAALELDKIVAILNENTSLNIEVSSHTDSRGSDAYNINLSNRRAKSSVDYLVSQGISRSRITAKGYGESRMVNKCVNGVECSEGAHAKNRRTDFVILNSQAYQAPEKSSPYKEDVPSLIETKKRTNDSGNEEKTIVKQTNIDRTNAITKYEDPIGQKNHENNSGNQTISSNDKTNLLKTDNIKNDLSRVDKKTDTSNEEIDVETVEESVVETEKNNGILTSTDKRAIANPKGQVLAKNDNQIKLDSDKLITQTNQKNNSIEKSEDTSITTSSNDQLLAEGGNQSKLDSNELLVQTKQKNDGIEKSEDTSITINSTDQLLVKEDNQSKFDSKNQVIDKVKTSTDERINNKGVSLKKGQSDATTTSAKSFDAKDTGFEKDLISETDNDQVVAVQPIKKKVLPENPIKDSDLSAEKPTKLDEDEDDTNEQAIVFNKDLSEANDNINAFSNSLEGNDNYQKVKEVVIPGKIEKNAPLKTGTLDVSAMMVKGNGNYVETDRAAKTHALRINFKMYKNGNISPGNKEIFIIIQNPKRKVINERGTFTLRTGEEIPYSDETVAYYDGNNINISILSDRFIQRIIRGTYIVQVYIERYLTGQTLLILS